MEAMMKNGKGVITESKNSFANSDISSHTPPFRMSPSVRNSSSRTSVYSPSVMSQPGIYKQNSAEDRSDGFRNSDGFKSELRGSRRLLQKQGSGMNYSNGSQANPGFRKPSTIEHTSYTEKKMPLSSIRRSQNSGSTISKYTLPDVVPKGNNVLPPIAGTSPGLMGSYQPSALGAGNPSGRRVGKSQRDYPFSDSINRPPLYKASETAREGTKFKDEPLGGPGPRYRSTYQTQTDFKNMPPEMNSSTGMHSNLNTIMTGSTIPAATFEISTTNYGGDHKLKKKDTLDEEINKFNLR